MEMRVDFRFFGDEIQEVPLRHERDEFAVRGQMRKVGYRHRKVVDDGSDLRQFLMWTAQEFVENSQLVHQFERGGMDGVASKIAQKIRVLFEHNYVDSGTSE